MYYATRYLSRSDIEEIAKPIIERYKQEYVPQYHLCYRVDAMEIAALLGIKVEFLSLSQDGAILGQTASVPVWTTVNDSTLGETYFFLDGKTILIEKRLQNNPHVTGRKNFTIAHELAHLIINNLYPDMYGAQFRIFSDYRRTKQIRPKISDWHEWQADALAAALLLPPDAVEDAMFLFGLGSKLNVLSYKYSQNKYHAFCDMAEFLQVSKSTLAYRMEQLGLLERNYMIREAQQRRHTNSL